MRNAEEHPLVQAGCGVSASTLASHPVKAMTRQAAVCPWARDLVSLSCGISVWEDRPRAELDTREPRYQEAPHTPRPMGKAPVKLTAIH